MEKVLKENCFPKEKAPLVIRSSSTGEEDIKRICDDNSNCELEEKIEIKFGNCAVALVTRKSRSLKFIARIDNYNEDNCEYEGVFLQKVDSKIDSGMGNKGQTFVANEKDAASFAPDDIALIIPVPVAAGCQKEEVINCGLILTLAN